MKGLYTMYWNYAYTPAIWPSLITAFLLFALMIYSWRRRSVPGAAPFALGCLFVMLIETGIIMTSLAVEPAVRLFWFRFQYTWWIPSATAITCFVLEYAWPGRWLTRLNLALLNVHMGFLSLGLSL